MTNPMMISIFRLFMCFFPCCCSPNQVDQINDHKNIPRIDFAMMSSISRQICTKSFNILSIVRKENDPKFFHTNLDFMIFNSRTYSFVKQVLTLNLSIVHLVKRDSPSSLSNLHHQTANASTNTPPHETLCLNHFYGSPITNKSPSAEISAMSTIKLTSASSSSTASLNSSHLANKMTKIPSNMIQQDHSSFNYPSRPDLNHESFSVNEKRPVSVTI